MGLKNKLAFVVAIPLVLAFAATSAEAQMDYWEGQLHIGGFVRLDGSNHYGPRNPANDELFPGAGQPQIQTENNSWNRFRLWAQVNFDLNPTNADWFSFFAKINFDGDYTQDIDSTLFPYDAFPDFPNDMSAQNDTNRLRLWELYADFRPGRFWFRIGRQTTAWGDTIAFRTTDIINPLDISWNPFGWPWFEEFQYIREPQWMLRASYNIPVDSVPDLEIETIVNFNFIPIALGDTGSPYSLVPAFIEQGHDNPDGAELGLRMRGTFGRWSLAGIYYYGYDDGGVLGAVDVFPDADRGIDLGFGCCFVLDFTNVHPRVNNIGATGNRYIQSVDGIFNFEFRLTPDQPYSHNAGPHEERSTLTYSVAFTKNFSIKALNYGRSFNMGFQLQQISIVSGRDDLEDLNASGSPLNKDNFLFNYTVGTGYKNDNIQPFFLLLWDFEGAAWFGPYVQFIHGNHLRFWVGFNHFVANDDTRGDAHKGFPVGVFDYADEFVWRIGYQF
jgi:hypothetical protein